MLIWTLACAYARGMLRLAGLARAECGSQPSQQQLDLPLAEHCKYLNAPTQSCSVLFVYSNNHTIIM